MKRLREHEVGWTKGTRKEGTKKHLFESKKGSMLKYIKENNDQHTQ